MLLVQQHQRYSKQSEMHRELQHCNERVRSRVHFTRGCSLFFCLQSLKTDWTKRDANDLEIAGLVQYRHQHRAHARANLLRVHRSKSDMKERKKDLQQSHMWTTMRAHRVCVPCWCMYQNMHINFTCGHTPLVNCSFGYRWIGIYDESLSSIDHRPTENCSRCLLFFGFQSVLCIQQTFWRLHPIFQVYLLYSLCCWINSCIYYRCLKLKNAFDRRPPSTKC